LPLRGEGHHYTDVLSPDDLTPHPDRLLPAEPGVRAIAHRLDEAVRRVPAWLDPALGDDDDVVATVVDQAGEIAPAGTA